MKNELLEVRRKALLKQKEELQKDKDKSFTLGKEMGRQWVLDEKTRYSEISYLLKTKENGSIVSLRDTVERFIGTEEVINYTFCNGFVIGVSNTMIELGF